MKAVFYLKTCNTCMRILKSIELGEAFYFQDIKEEPIRADQLDQLMQIAGSYEAMFSRRAKLYKEMGLKDQELDEKDYRHYILDHYTFLKRPVIVDDEDIYIGSEKKTVEKLTNAFAKSSSV